MNQKSDNIKMSLSILIIILFMFASVMIIRNGIEQSMTDQNYILQTETLLRKASMVSNCFDNGKSILRKSVENSRGKIESASVGEERLGSVNDAFYDRILYVEPSGKIFGNTSGYKEEFIENLGNISQKKDDIVALKNGDEYIFVFVTALYINEQPGGAFLGLYGSEHISDMMSDTHSGKPERNVISLSDGTVIAVSEGTRTFNGENAITSILGDKAKDKFYSNEEYLMVIENMNNESEKSFNYRMKGNSGDTLVSVVKIESTPFVITQYLHSKEMQEMKIKGTIYYTIIIVLAFLVLLVFIVMTQIYNIRERRNLEKLAKSDNMTGLLNHNAAIDKIKNDVGNNSCGALMILDIDEFKTINDTYGHLFGDKVIKRVTICICDNFSNGEILGRFGGDEFIVYMPNESNEQYILQKADKLICAIKGLDFSNGCNVCGSVGVAIHKGPDVCAKTLIKRADDAMYQAKNKGKNQYSLYSE